MRYRPEVVVFFEQHVDKIESGLGQLLGKGVEQANKQFLCELVRYAPCGILPINALRQPVERFESAARRLWQEITFCFVRWLRHADSLLLIHVEIAVA